MGVGGCHHTDPISTHIGLRVHIRPALDQQLRDGRVALHSRPVKGCLTILHMGRRARGDTCGCERRYRAYV